MIVERIFVLTSISLLFSFLIFGWKCDLWVKDVGFWIKDGAQFIEISSLISGLWGVNIAEDLEELTSSILCFLRFGGLFLSVSTH